MFGYGNARHPAQDDQAPQTSGAKVIARNSRAESVIVCGPSRQSVQLASTMATAVNTASPMSTGGPPSRVWGGDAGYGVNRMAGRIDPRQVAGMVGGAISPVIDPLNSSIRVGMQSGPSQQPAYPSTGQEAGATYAGPLAWMSLGQVGPGIG